MWLQPVCACVLMSIHNVCCVYTRRIAYLKLQCAFDGKKNRAEHKKNASNTIWADTHTRSSSSEYILAHVPTTYTHTFPHSYIHKVTRNFSYTVHNFFFSSSSVCHTNRWCECVCVFLCSSVFSVCFYVGHPMKSDVISCIGPPSCINAHLSTQL